MHLAVKLFTRLFRQHWPDKKTLSSNNAKGLTMLRTKLKKYNREFETEITDYREKPDDGESEDEEEQEEEEGTFIWKCLTSVVLCNFENFFHLIISNIEC